MEPIRVIDRGRGPELADVRVTVYDVLPYLQKGWHHASIGMVFGISSDHVLALKQYFEEHKEEVLAENQKILERIARGNPPEIEERRKESHARVMALREELERKRQERNGEGNPG
jgi:uncharacterized protein (DUF433 family)